MDRISTARERLRVSSLQVEEATTRPCIHCRWFELACEHPAVAKLKISPVSGSGEFVPACADEARSPNGLCGPEGELFEERSLPGQFFVWMVTDKKGRLTAAALAFSLYYWLG